MSFTEDKVNNGHTPGKSSLLIALVLFAAILCAAVAVYMQSSGIELSFEGLRKTVGNFGEAKNISDDEENVVLDFPDEHQINACGYRDMIVKCSSEGVQFFDKAGSNVKELDISFTSPLLKTNGTDLIAADIGGEDFCIIHGTEIKWEKETDGPIVNADIGKSGYVTVIEQSKGYKNRVSVYDSYGVEKFYRNIADDRVISAETSPGGEQMALLTLDTSGVFANPGLEYLDLKGKSLTATVPATGQIFSLMQWFDDNSLIISSDNMLVSFNKEREKSWSKEFKEISSITGAPGRTTVAAYKTKQGLYEYGTNIGFFSSKGQQKADCQLEDDIKCLRSYSGTIAAFSSRKAYFLNASGRVIGEYSAKSDITDIFFFSKIEAAVVTRNSIVIIKI